ncbi:MAG: DNA repair protein RecO [Gemmatimonadales bacterium]|nr:DNA repair protein RecO [Gemmatimonadales bacterium]MDQ3427160.1 DNA repair protein RecO [Gemmatimonadota bacterium]
MSTFLTTPAIVLSAIRYSETSKIVRLATREFGVQSAIAKGALRPRSRFGAALQLLSEGQAHLLVKEHRELHTLAAFDLVRLRVGLARELERYATASALAEVMVHFAPADPHPESYERFRQSLDLLETAPSHEVQPLGYRVLWQLVSVLGFAPSLDSCVRDGTALPATGGLPFNTREGGALCPTCAAQYGATQLPQQARVDLGALLDASSDLPRLDDRHAAAHRRLLARYIRYHLAEGAELPALEFWVRRPWMAA